MIIIYGDVDDIRTKLGIRLKKLYNYADSNYAENIMNRKLIMKYAFIINGNIITWLLKKQHIIFILIMKTKYIILKHAVKKTV